MIKGSIFKRFLLLIVVVVILPVSLVYSMVSSKLIRNLHDNYNESVNSSAYMASMSIGDALGSIIDTSISIIGNVKVREYLTDKKEEDLFQLYSSAKTSIENYYLTNNYISHILVSSIDGTRTLSTDSKFSYEFSQQEKERMLDSKGGWFWVNEANGRTAICRLIRNVGNVEEKIGFVKIVINDESLKRQFYTDERSAKADYVYAVLDSGDRDIFLITDEEAKSELLSFYMEHEQEIKKSRNYVKQQKDNYLVFNRIGTRSVYLAVAARDQTLYYKIMKYGFNLLFLFLFLIASGLYAVIYHRTIVVPLSVLGRQMKLLKPGSGAPQKVEIEAEGEVKELINSFNTMSAQLEELYETNYKNELKLRDANLLILQSEINPHFLYNVLDSVRWMIELEQKEAASGMVQKLSEMFRLSLELSNESVIYLNKELEHLEKYISIENYRFQDKIHFQMNIQKELQEEDKNPLVIKFILQPLIENAVVHGISKSSGYGTVVLSIYRTGEELVYDIRDDGCGADPVRIQKILERKLIKQNCLEGFALENIQSRLRLRYGDRYGIEYRLREGGGSIFIVRQPLVFNKGGQEKNEADDCG